MSLSPAALYRAHVKNLHAVRDGINQVERELRAALARGDRSSSDALLKILLLLIGGWAECRLRKLLFEANGFDDDQRIRVVAERRQIDSWRKAVEIGFRRRYGVPKAALDVALLPIPKMLYQSLCQAIEQDLGPVIEMRNTLAHGQWARPLNSDGDKIATVMLAAIKKENALSARYKVTLLEALAASIHDLVSGGVAFERDFNKHFSAVEAARRDLRNRDYEKWRTSMVEKFRRGQVRRNNALQQ